MDGFSNGARGLSHRFAWRGLCALAVPVAIALSLAACEPPPKPQAAAAPQAPPPAPVETTNRTDRQGYFRLPHTPTGSTPVRVAMLLPLSNPSADTRAVAEALERAAQLALFESRNPNIILMPRDDGGSPDASARAATRAIAEGAEIILGPLFAQSVTSVAPVAATQNVPVVAFSTDRSVAGRGVYLLSFQPEDEVRRIVSYAAAKGHSAFSAMIPQTAYGQKVGDAFRAEVAKAGGQVRNVETFVETPEATFAPAKTVATAHPDAVLIAEGGNVLRAIAPTLALNGASAPATKFLGTGLWDDATVGREPMLLNGWYAAPSPTAWQGFARRYQQAFGAAPPRIASLGYDAMSLVVLLSSGRPYLRYTQTTLTDPNGFSGIDGIFRFHADGSVERGLAIMQVGQTGATVIDPAPQTFQLVGF